MSNAAEVGQKDVVTIPRFIFVGGVIAGSKKVL